MDSFVSSAFKHRPHVCPPPPVATGRSRYITPQQVAPIPVRPPPPSVPLMEVAKPDKPLVTFEDPDTSSQRVFFAFRGPIVLRHQWKEGQLQLVNGTVRITDSGKQQQYIWTLCPRCRIGQATNVAEEQGRARWFFVISLDCMATGDKAHFVTETSDEGKLLMLKIHDAAQCAEDRFASFEAQAQQAALGDRASLLNADSSPHLA